MVHLDLVRELRQDALELKPDALRAAARVGEDERGAKGLQQLAQFLQHARGGVTGGRIGIAAQRRKDLHNRLLRLGRRDDLARPPRPGQEFSHRCQRRDGCRKTDAAQRLRDELREPLRAHHQVRPALVLRQGMNLVDDEEAPLRQRRHPRVLAEQDGETLRRGDQDVRRLAPLRRPFLGRRVAGAHAHAHIVKAELRQRSTDVLLQIVSQRAQGRDINRDDPVRQRPLLLQLREMIKNPQKRRQSLPTPRRRTDQDRPPGHDVPDRLHLNIGRCLELAPEPFADLWLQPR